MTEELNFFKHSKSCMVYSLTEFLAYLLFKNRLLSDRIKDIIENLLEIVSCSDYLTLHSPPTYLNYLRLLLLMNGTVRAAT